MIVGAGAAGELIPGAGGLDRAPRRPPVEVGA